MTRRLVSNSLYTYIKGAISNVVPMEYAIRASEALSPASTDQLRLMNSQIRQKWQELGATETEIDGSQLMDVAWDCIQVGFPLMRRHTTRYGLIFYASIVMRGRIEIPRTFGESFSSIDLPASRFFRICDLLNGNDIGKLMETTSRLLSKGQKFKDADEIPLSYFQGFRPREPIHLCPGMKYIHRDPDSGNETFGLSVDLNEPISPVAFHRQIAEFTYQYALQRASIHGADDGLSRSLIGSVLTDELFGRHSEKPLELINSLASLLSGLYCWDKVKKHGMKMKGALEETSKLYPQSEEAIKKNYRTAVAAIETAKGELGAFQSAEYRNT